MEAIGKSELPRDGGQVEVGGIAAPAGKLEVVQVVPVSGWKVLWRISLYLLLVPAAIAVLVGYLLELAA